QQMEINTWGSKTMKSRQHHQHAVQVANRVTLGGLGVLLIDEEEKNEIGLIQS
ncbi:hypothetical protein ACTXT7_004885, partial [Hymenolepis weldensis]